MMVLNGCEIWEQISGKRGYLERRKEVGRRRENERCGVCVCVVETSRMGRASESQI